MAAIIQGHIKYFRVTKVRDTLHLTTLGVCLFYCKEHKVETIKIENPKILIARNFDSLRLTLNKNIEFIGDSLLKGKISLMQSYLRKYQRDTCGIITY